MNRILTIALFIGLTSSTIHAQGTFLWDESVDGPLSNDSGTPTPLPVLPFGENSLRGVTEYVSAGENGALYGDYFTFTIPSSAYVSSLILNVDKPVLVWLGNPTFSQNLAHAFNPSNGGLLQQLGLASIESGTYGMYVKMNDFTASDAANYRFDFFVQAVPEPGTISLGLLGLGLLAFRFWKRGNSAR